MVSEKIKEMVEQEWKESKNLTTRRRITVYGKGKQNHNSSIRVQMIEIDCIPRSKIKNVYLSLENLERKNKKCLKIFQITTPVKVSRKHALQYMSDYAANGEILICGVIDKNSCEVVSAWIGRAVEISKRRLK